MTGPSKVVKVLPSDPESASLWSDFGRLASQVLPEGWTLVGGLMVQLHAKPKIRGARPYARQSGGNAT